MYTNQRPKAYRHSCNDFGDIFPTLKQKFNYGCFIFKVSQINLFFIYNIKLVSSKSNLSKIRESICRGKLILFANVFLIKNSNAEKSNNFVLRIKSLIFKNLN